MSKSLGLLVLGTLSQKLNEIGQVNFPKLWLPHQKKKNDFEKNTLKCRHLNALSKGVDLPRFSAVDYLYTGIISAVLSSFTHPYIFVL